MSNVVAMAPPKPLRWNDRDVVFHEYDIVAGREIRRAFESDRETGAFLILQKSAHYADSGELVFQSVAEIEKLPNRVYGRLMRLATAAIEQVGQFEPDDDDPPT
jgi:hypothetical protein